MVDTRGGATGHAPSGRVRASADDDAALLRLVLVVAAYGIGGLTSFVVLTVMGWPEVSGWGHVVRAGIDLILAVAWPFTWAAQLCLCLA